MWISRELTGPVQEVQAEPAATTPAPVASVKDKDGISLEQALATEPEQPKPAAAPPAEKIEPEVPAAAPSSSTIEPAIAAEAEKPECCKAQAEEKPKAEAEDAAEEAVKDAVAVAAAPAAVAEAVESATGTAEAVPIIASPLPETPAENTTEAPTETPAETPVEIQAFEAEKIEVKDDKLEKVEKSDGPAPVPAASAPAAEPEQAKGCTECQPKAAHPGDADADTKTAEYTAGLEKHEAQLREHEAIAVAHQAERTVAQA